MKRKSKVYGVILSFTLALTLTTPLSNAQAAKTSADYPYAEEIAALQPGTTPEEVIQSAKQLAKQENVKTEAILKQFHQEITADKAEGDKIAKKATRPWAAPQARKTAEKLQREHLLYQLLHSLL